MGFFACLRSDPTLNFAAESDAALTPSSEATGYPVENATIADDIALRWRTTDAAFETVLFEFASARTIDFCALVNHNLSSGATIAVKAGTTSSVSDLSVSMTWREFDAWVKFSSTSKAFWKIEVADSGNADGFIAIGLIMLGVRQTLSFGFNNGWREVRNAINQSGRSTAGVANANIQRMFRQRSYSMAWNDLAASEVVSLVGNLLEPLHGDAEPLLVIPDIDIYQGAFVRQASQPEIEHVSWRQKTVEATFTEEPRGVITGA